jgi:hypothetical protein
VGHRAAVVVCVHHKPWLVMGTLITLLLQDEQDVDVYLLYNVGAGQCPEKVSYEPYRRFATAGEPLDVAVERASYTGYDRLASGRGINPKLSPFDERVRAVSHLRREGVQCLEFENDHALDSGAWYKFIRTGLWEKYEHVVFVPEGTLFTRPSALGASLWFIRDRKIDFVAGGHIKRRMPRSTFLGYSRSEEAPTPLDRFHDEMIAATFDVFRRDPDFARVFDRWPDDGPVTTEHHLPDIWGGPLWRRLRNAADSRVALPSNPLKRAIAGALRRHRDVFPRLGVASSRVRVGLGLPAPAVAGDAIYVDAVRRRVREVVAPIEADGVRFHAASEVEWFGACCNHVFSRRFLDRLAERLERHRLYEVLDLPFAGSALEVTWGLMPAWLGVDKWFFDGIHRISKNPATARREDEPPEVADYINRYYPGRIAVGWEGDLLKVRAARAPHAERLRSALPEAYF